MHNYKVVSNSRIELLEREISELLRQGWSPLGGIAVAYKHEHSPNVVSHLVYCQAMLKTS